MRSFDTETQARLASGEPPAKYDLLLFDFPSGLWGFNSGLGPLVYSGVTYIGAGKLLQMESLGANIGLSAQAVTCRLSSIPNTDLTPDVLATIEAEQWHQRPVVISRAYVDPETRAIISVERMYRGYVDKLEHEIGTTATITAYFESKARDHLKKGYRVRGDADQRRINANDTGLINVATAVQQDIQWGRQPESAVNVMAKSLTQ